MARIYSEKYDAYADLENDIWVDGKCGEPTCKFCAHRPEKPSQVKPSEWWKSYAEEK